MDRVEGGPVTSQRQAGHPQAPAPLGSGPLTAHGPRSLPVWTAACCQEAFWSTCCVCRNPTSLRSRTPVLRLIRNLGSGSDKTSGGLDSLLGNLHSESGTPHEVSSVEPEATCWVLLCLITNPQPRGPDAPSQCQGTQHSLCHRHRLRINDQIPCVNCKELKYNF